jgi:hypothetical protein
VFRVAECGGITTRASGPDRAPELIRHRRDTWANNSVPAIETTDLTKR